jgi:acetyltransferase-like isoleucine patch superfamily enzyme
MIKNIKKSILFALRGKLFRVLYGRLPRPEDYFSFGDGVVISPDCEIEHPGCVSLGNDVRLERLVWLIPILETSVSNRTPKLIIDDGSSIGRMTVISAINRVEIGKRVLIGPRVHIADCNHNYEDITQPVNDQGWAEPGQTIIRDQAWIGVNTVIIASRGKTLEIGRHSIIGANSVVTGSVPDYCVAVGSPARVIRRYSEQSKKWHRVDRDGRLEQLENTGSTDMPI